MLDVDALISALKFNGTPGSLYTDALISLFSATYQEDIDLYLRRIGAAAFYFLKSAHCIRHA